MVGNQDSQTAKLFIDDLASRLANRVQLTTDGYVVYLDAVSNHGGTSDDTFFVTTLQSQDFSLFVTGAAQPQNHDGKSPASNWLCPILQSKRRFPPLYATKEYQRLHSLFSL